MDSKHQRLAALKFVMDRAELIEVGDDGRHFSGKRWHEPLSKDEVLSWIADSENVDVRTLRPQPAPVSETLWRAEIESRAEVRFVNVYTKHNEAEIVSEWSLMAPSPSAGQE